MTADGRDWLEALVLPDAARQQITVAREMVDALEVQIAPLDRQLRSYARRQIGCRALIDAHHEIGPLCSVTILAELGNVGRFDNSRAVRYGGMDTRRPRPRAVRVPPTATGTSRPPSTWAVTAPAWRSRASCSNAATTRYASSAPTPSNHPSSSGEVAEPRAARQAAASACPSVPRPTRAGMSWRLDPGSGSALGQPSRQAGQQAGTPEHVELPPADRSRASRPLSYRCAAAGSRHRFADTWTRSAWTAQKD
jgi:hypothetical protein